MNKKGQMTTQNKSKGKIANYSVNNSYANFKKKFGTKLYNNYNINDKTFTNNLNRLKENNINDNIDILKNKSNNKNLIIDCGYYSNKEKYDISGGNYIKKKKPYISSVPCSTRKSMPNNENTNANTSTKKEKDIISNSSKKKYAGVNSSLVTKYKNKIKPLIRASLYKNKEKNNNISQKVNKTKIYTKRIIDNSTYNLAQPKTTRRVGNESILDKTSSNYKINSDLNSFDISLKKDINRIHSKINTLRKENEKLKEKISKK